MQISQLSTTTDQPFYFLNKYILLPSIITLDLPKHTLLWCTPILHYITRQYRTYIRQNTIDAIDGSTFGINLPIYFFFNYRDGAVASKQRIMPREDYWLVENLPIYPHLLLYVMLDDFLHSKKITHYFNKYPPTIAKDRWLIAIKKIKKKCYKRLIHYHFSRSMLHTTFHIDLLFNIFYTYEKCHASSCK